MYIYILAFVYIWYSFSSFTYIDIAIIYFDRPMRKILKIIFRRAKAQMIKAVGML